MLLDSFDGIRLMQITYFGRGSQAYRVITMGVMEKKAIGDIALKFGIDIKQIYSH